MHAMSLKSDPPDDIAVPEVVHIGYPRTGSTYLQETVFPAYDSWIQLTNQASFFFKDEEFGKGVDHYLEMLPQSEPGKTVVESDETLSGNQIEDHPGVADRLHDILPNARIVVCLRSQFTAIRSYYKIYLKNGGRNRFPEYARMLIENGRYDYEKLVSRYLDLYPEENVLILFYENLNRNPQEFLTRLIRFIGIDEDITAPDPGWTRHESPAPVISEANRYLNKLLGGTPMKEALGPVGFRIVRRAFWTLSRVNPPLESLGVFPDSIGLDEVSDDIADRYGSGNRRLFKRIGETKRGRRFGYPGFRDSDRRDDQD